LDRTAQQPDFDEARWCCGASSEQDGGALDAAAGQAVLTRAGA
jgi:hypothetical protein